MPEDFEVVRVRGVDQLSVEEIEKVQQKIRLKSINEILYVPRLVKSAFVGSESWIFHEEVDKLIAVGAVVAFRDETSIVLDYDGLRLMHRCGCSPVDVCRTLEV